MSIRKNTWDLDGHYDLTNSGLNSYVGAGTLFNWGYNPYGQLGQNDKTYYSSPVQVPGTQWKYVSASSLNVLSTKSDGTLWSIGLDQFGQLGVNTRAVNQSSPVQIPGTQWDTATRHKITAGNHTLMAIKTDNTLWAWGYNQGGQLAQNDLTHRSSPTQIPGTQWKSISMGKRSTGYGAVATKNDGTLWAWGTNGLGNLGHNDKTEYSSPRQIPGTQWNIAVTGGYMTAATKTDGTLWLWGYNAAGELGQNDLIYYSSPVQVPGTQWNLQTCGQYGKHVLKTDGTLWVWGLNNYGMLGLNTANAGTHRSSPVQVPGTQWSFVSSGSYGATVLKTDGTLWVWGHNAYGTLGLNNVTYYSSPRQIPGTQWNVLTDSYDYNVSAIQQQ